MAAKAITNMLKRGKVLLRVVLKKNTGTHRPVEVRQPAAETIRFQTFQNATPIRAFLFTSRVSIQTIASQLRRKAAFEFGRKQQLPFLGFVGLALASSGRNENDVLSEEIRETLQTRIKTSPIIQQLSLDSFDLGHVIGRGCNAVVYEAKYKITENIERDIISIEKSSDYEVVEEDKWFPPEDSVTVQQETTLIVQDEVQREITVDIQTQDDSDSFIILDDDVSESFSFVSSPDHCFEYPSTQDNSIIQPIAIAVLDNDNDLEDLTVEDSEDDKWMCPDNADNNNSTKYDLAIKMMFNYEVESNAEHIMRAMEKETVPAKVPVFQLGESWEISNRVRLKSLPHHPNIVDMVGAFVDPVSVPELSVAMETYPAALPRRLYEQGLGRNMTMYIVMKRYDMTLRQYLQDQKPNIRTRCLLLAQLLEGIVHLCQHGVAHRDIKSDNLFIEMSEDGSTPKLVIGDFGCCLANTDYGQKLPFFTRDVDRGGNCSLMAPEISTATAGPGVWLDYSKADLWAVGSLMYELFGLDNPFYPNQSQRLLDSRTYREEELPKLPDDVPVFLQSLAMMMLCRDPKRRISPIDATNLMQMFLWLPDWFLNKPSPTRIQERLLVLAAQVILQRENREPEHSLLLTFLQRLNVNELVRIINICYGVD